MSASAHRLGGKRSRATFQLARQTGEGVALLVLIQQKTGARLGGLVSRLNICRETNAYVYCSSV